MRFYLLERNSYDYDEEFAFVIQANSPTEARELACGPAEDRQDWWRKYRLEWLDRNKSTCKVLSYTKRPRIILDSYNAG